MGIARTFYLRRFHSLIGLLLGGFLLKHILTMILLLAGGATFDWFIQIGHFLPGKWQMGADWLIVILPLGFHTIYGIMIGRQAKNNPHHYPTLVNWQFTLQRWSAWVILVFLLDHVLFFGLIVPWNGIPMNYAFLQHSVQDPLYFWMYLIGMCAAIFHFFNGITTFSMTWGICKGPRSQQVINWLCMVMMAMAMILILVSLVDLRYFAG